MLIIGLSLCVCQQDLFIIHHFYNNYYYIFVLSFVQLDNEFLPTVHTL